MMTLHTIIKLPRLLFLINILFFYSTLVIVAEGNIKNKLVGMHLRAAIPNDPPFSEVRPDGQYEGVAVDALWSLQQKLGFTVTLNNYTKGSRQFIEEIHNCSSKDGSTKNCHFDIGVGAFTVTYEKLMKHISFVEPFIESQAFRVLTKARKTRTRCDYWLLFKPFSLTLWLMLIGLWLIAILTVCLIHLWLGSTNRDTIFSPRTSMEALGSSVFAIFGCSPQSTGTTFLYATRAVVFGMALVMFFVFISYESSLVSMKSLGLERSSKFRTVQDFANCEIKLSDVTVVNNSAEMSFLDRHVATAECHENKKRYQVCDTFQECVEKVISEEAEFSFTTSGVVDYFVHGRYCGEVVSVGKSFVPQRVGYVVAKDADILEPLNLAMLRLEEEGRLPTLQSKILRCDALIREETVPDGELLLPLAFGGIVYFCFIIAATFVLLKRIFRRRSKKGPTLHAAGSDNSEIDSDLDVVQDPELNLAYYRTNDRAVID